MDEFSPFAQAIYEQKYAHEGETWPDTAERVASNVLGSLYYTPGARGGNYEQINDAETRIQRLIEDRRFLPGGRYLYAAGRDYHQVQNCLMLRAEDSREGWAELSYKSEMSLMTGAGIGVDYSELRENGAPVKRTGGVSSGPLAKMKMINEIGRNVMQGGNRRSAIWAGLRWSHPDVMEFIRAKDWSPEVRAAKEKDFNHPADLDMTNISVILDREFFEAYEANDSWAVAVYRSTLKRMLKTAEPGFSVDYDDPRESLRNACTELVSADDSDICLAAGSRVLTERGYVAIEDVTVEDKVATQKEGQTTWQSPERVWSNGVHETIEVELADRRSICVTPNHKILTQNGWREAKELQLGDEVVIHASTPPKDDEADSPIDAEFYSLGWLVGDGWFTEKPGFGYVFGSPDDADSEKVIAAWLSENGCKVSVQEQANGVRCLSVWARESKQRFIEGYGIIPATATGKSVPVAVWDSALWQKRSFLAGLFAADGSAKGHRRNAILASSSKQVLRGVQLLLDEMGIYSWCGWYAVPGRNDQGVLIVNGKSLPRFSDEVGFGYVEQKNDLLRKKVAPKVDTLGRVTGFVSNPTTVKVRSIKEHGKAEVFDLALKEDHHFIAEGIVVHNCNLGSLNMARFETKEQFASAVKDATLFLLAGTCYSDVPYDEVAAVREKNRRLGLGIMGVHEWLLKRGKGYGPDDELGEWLAEYQRSTEYAHDWADRFDLSRPVKTRAIAPTGTIGILGETTTGIEPIFCVAYKRRYLVAGEKWSYQYVIDPTAKRLIENDGVDPDSIEDAYSLSYDAERRVEFQAWVQQYVDHGISSTINLPGPVTEPSEVSFYADLLIHYLPKLRGITVYPDGARGGQPLTAATYAEASGQQGVVFEETEERCVGGTCGV